MKRLLLSTLFTLFAVAAFAQKGTVTGTVVDAETGETVAGAVLEFSPAGAPTRNSTPLRASRAPCRSLLLAYGEYKLVVSFLGYNSAETTFKVSAAKQDIGKIELRPGVQIETVVKEAKALRTSQKGDTVSYNAGAFKVTDDADVEGLLKEDAGHHRERRYGRGTGRVGQKDFRRRQGIFRRGRDDGHQVAAGTGCRPHRGLQQTERRRRILGHGRRRGL
ncbi:MAG: hypothetical protein ACLUQ6_03620 [Alistipes onderdonkii]